MQEFKSCCIQDPTQYYWYEETLQVSKNIEDAGIGINKHLLGCLAVSWVVVYICIIRGIKSSGKVLIYYFLLLIVIYATLFPGLLAFLISGRQEAWERGCYIRGNSTTSHVYDTSSGFHFFLRNESS